MEECKGEMEIGKWKKTIGVRWENKAKKKVKGKWRDTKQDCLLRTTCNKNMSIMIRYVLSLLI